ncbi:MAG: hypothetical protein F7B59_03710 [Desulfurococcales archaeon]|nr:hypothetical protein [Desulfurococcales archaeon]
MKRKIVSTTVDEETYKLLKRKSELKGYKMISDYVRYLIESDLSESEKSVGALSFTKDLDGLLDKKISRIERLVADLLNPYTGKIDKIIALLNELREEIEQTQTQKLSIQSQSQVREYRGEAEQGKPLVSYRREPPPVQRKSAIERLKEEGAVFESDLGWLKRPDLFFSKLEREGAIVFESGEERVAVDSQFFEELKAKLKEINIPEAEAVEKLLRPQEARLFRLLVDSGRAYYDSVERGWYIEL